MAFNFIDTGGKVCASSTCVYDSNIGYETDFSKNGDVDGWTIYDGIHTYGCWNNFLFGTLYGETSLIERPNIFRPVEAEYFYTIKLVMKLNIKERIGTQNIPEYGKVAWVTESDPNWSLTKEATFSIITDNKWHTYYINMGEAQWWQGDIHNLRVYPILQDGKDGDEFFIRGLKILSVGTFKCNNPTCDYFSNYTYKCPGIGLRGVCTSMGNGPLKKYNIVEGINDEFLININGYGYETVKLQTTGNISGGKLANSLARAISKINTGGYSGAEVEYNEIGQFIIRAGTCGIDSTVTVGNTLAAVSLNFYDEMGNYQATECSGQYPASGYRPISSFKINTNQMLGLFDENENQEVMFNPFVYNIEGGRRDWLNTGLGSPEKDGATSVMRRTYGVINNINKTIIDFNHPFNASGKIVKIYIAAATNNEAEVMFFRPLKNGTLKVLDITVPIENEDTSDGSLHSVIQEYIELDCDVSVNKGDLIGVFSADIYKGRSLTGNEVDALFYQIEGKASGVLNLGPPSGQGNAGLLLYARSDQLQSKIVLDVDLSKRLNIEGIEIIGDVLNEKLEYNIARCLDINWNVDIFGGDHTTMHTDALNHSHYFNHPNIFYGKNCLNDGVNIVTGGVAAESFTVDIGTDYGTYEEALHKKDGGHGVIINAPAYFQVNGDSEWTGSTILTKSALNDFKHDPVAFTLVFPGGAKKNINKVNVYFKERYNFRSFALSFFKGEAYCLGTADDPSFDLIPYRLDEYNTPWTKVILDGSVYTPEDTNKWGTLDLYLAHNPIIGSTVLDYEKGKIVNNDQFNQSLNIDWAILTMEWPESEELGFRLYCDYHESTKICELELFCTVVDIASSITGAISVDYSLYGEGVLLSETVQDSISTVSAFIGDTPRYITIEIEPIIGMSIKNININLGTGDFFLGEKGCQQYALTPGAKTGEIGETFLTSFKNVYGQEYDLCVDIVESTIATKGLLFYSKLNNSESIVNTEIGPDAYYRKGCDYAIANANYNVAINCFVYGLKNLADDADVWYTHDNMYSWKYLGKFSGESNADFINLPDMTMTTLNMPVLKRSKWWKIGFLDSNISTEVTEIHVYYKGEEIPGVNFYHSTSFYHNSKSYIDDKNIDCAPNLNNGVVDGSYCILTGNYYIGIELPEVQAIDQILIYHSSLGEYSNVTDVAGIDRSTALNIKGYGKLYQTDTIYDYSYYEHRLEIVGNGIYCDNRTNFVDSFIFTEDFSDCTSLVDWATNTQYNSVFTCCSGISGEDWVYEFDLGMGQASNAAGYRIPKVYDLQYKPLDERWAFEFKFKFNLESMDSSPDSVGVGIFNERTYSSSGLIPYYFEGVQMLFGHNSFGLVVQSAWDTGDIDRNFATMSDGLLYNTTYYCTLKSNGEGVYTAKAWTDNWDGADQVCDLSRTIYVKWVADKIGVLAEKCFYGIESNRSKGWVTDFDFSSSLVHNNNVFNNSSIRCNGNVNEYLRVNYHNNLNCNINRYGFDFKDKHFTIDTFIKFFAMPADGSFCVVASCWKSGTTIDVGNKEGSSWALVLENTSNIISLKLYIVTNTISTLVFNYDWNPDVHRWYNFYLCRGEDAGIYYAYFVLDGHIVWHSHGNDIRWGIVDTTDNDIKIGENFNGWLQEFRISSDDILGGVRVPYCNKWDQDIVRYNMEVTPTRPFERYYTFQVYVSENNEYYGLLGYVDCLFDNSFSYHEPLSSFSQGYNTCFALDLGHRYSLEIIRSFPVDEAHLFNLLENVLYSNKNIADPSFAFELLSIEMINNAFNGLDGAIPNNWFVFDGAEENYILGNKLVQCVTNDFVRLRSDFYLVGDFDFEIEYELTESPNQEYWSNRLQIQDVNNLNNKIGFERAFYNGTNYYRLVVQEDGTGEVFLAGTVTLDKKAFVRFTRNGQIFTVYVKNTAVEEYVLAGVFEPNVLFSTEILLDIITQSEAPGYPRVRVEWDNLLFNCAFPVYSVPKDTRWVGIKMWNGDGITKLIKRIGIYSDITVQSTIDGKYNNEWVALGQSTTNYTTENNIALNVEVMASSFVGIMGPENAVNGLLTTELEQAWGSEEGVPQWITIKLAQETQIYRVKLYFGYDGSNEDSNVTDYELQVSTDNVNFTTILTEVGNTSHERTHDFFDPISTVYVRIYITDYESKIKYIKGEDNYLYWAGVNIRQINVYEYYGTNISSEEYPIIALDLRENYFILGHSMIGIDSESTDEDWSNDDSNYTYSNSNLSEPQKVTFGGWGQLPDYEKWVAIKRNTATHYPVVPDVDNPFRDTPDYLKHTIIQGAVDRNGTKPNPMEHFWMWSSNISILDYNYEYIKGPYKRALEIKYPESTQSEHIFFGEGDDFGIDEEFSWRDALEFHWYIDDIDNLNLEYGYIYFGGYDSTSLRNPVIHKWNLTTLSGVLNSGWNDLSLIMMDADEIEWTWAVNPSDLDPKRLHTLTLQKLGIVFMGKGNAITMYITGFVIHRNHFDDFTSFDKGLYLCNRDILKLNIGELNLHSATLEFFIRPDWSLNGVDICNEFKFRSLFHFSNVVNDVFGAIISTQGLEICYGNITDNFNVFVVSVAKFNTINRLIHMAFVVSSDGTGIDSDGSTIRVYFNNTLVAKTSTTWKVTDEKHFNFVFGGQSLLLQKDQGGPSVASSVDGVISNIKMHNYCKIDFTDSITSPEIENSVVVAGPCSLIEISKDNLTFHKVGGVELPFYYENVLDGEVVPIYMRTIIPDNLIGRERRTAEIIGQWDIGV